MRAIGRRLELLRRRHGWTYRELEQRTGLPHSTLQYLITRRQTVPDYYTLVALVRRLGGVWDPTWETLWQQAATPAPQPSGGSASPAGQLPDRGNNR